MEEPKITRYFKYQTQTHILEGGEAPSHTHPVLRQWTMARCTCSVRDLPLCLSDTFVIFREQSHHVPLTSLT